LFIGRNTDAYHFRASASGDTTFVRDFAGDIDTLALPVDTNSVLLSVTLSGGNLVLSYPGWASSFTVESSTNLTSPAWAVVTNPPSINGDTTSVVLTITASHLYFRLRE